MTCNGNCGNCKSPCSAINFMAKLTANEENKECESIMSEELVKVAGCGAPTEPDHIRANAAILALRKENKELKRQLSEAGASTPLCFGLKTTTCVAAVSAIIALVMAFLAYCNANRAICENEKTENRIEKIFNHYHSDAE